MNEFSPCWVVQTKSGGAWSCGNYDNDNLMFTFGTKANIDSGTNSVSQVYITSGRRLNAAGYDTSSDRRLKTHIKNLGKSAIEFVKSLKPAKFKMDGNTRVGFYAQDVQEACGDVDMVDEDSQGMLSLDYMQLIAPLVATTQDLLARVETLEAELAEAGASAS